LLLIFEEIKIERPYCKVFQSDDTLSRGWVTISPMKKITREIYQELRKTVRRHIWANSREVTLKKYHYLFGYTVMGGVVTRKRITRRRQSFLTDVRHGIVEKYGCPVYDLNTRRSEDWRPALDLALEVFDFSGSFEIRATCNHETPHLEDFFRKVRKGDIVFARGQVMFAEKTGGLRFEASWLGFEHELIHALKTHPDDFHSARLITEAVKKGAYYFKWDLCAGFTHPERPEIYEWRLKDFAMVNAEEAIRFFYRKGRPKEDIPGFLEALFAFYWRKRCRWIPRLIVKYFKIMVREGLGKDDVKRYGWWNEKQRFLSCFPLLQRKIIWSGNKIDNLRLKECARDN